MWQQEMQEILVFYRGFNVFEQPIWVISFGVNPFIPGEGDEERERESF